MGEIRGLVAWHTARYGCLVSRSVSATFAILALAAQGCGGLEVEEVADGEVHDVADGEAYDVADGQALGVAIGLPPGVADGGADAGPSPASNLSSNCPAVPPWPGKACAPVGQECEYSGPGGGYCGNVDAICSTGGYWQSAGVQCPDPGCPSALPGNGSACGEPDMRCIYPLNASVCSAGECGSGWVCGQIDCESAAAGVCSAIQCACDGSGAWSCGAIECQPPEAGADGGGNGDDWVCSGPACPPAADAGRD